MATETDDFTGGRDSALWDEYKENVSVSITDVSDAISITNSLGPSYDGGLVRKVTRDLTAPSSAEIIVTNTSQGGGIVISLQKTTTTPYTNNDWYRAISVGTTGYAQKRIGGGTPTTIWSGTGGGAVTHKIDLPSSGDDVRFIFNAVEKASDATYALSSRDCYNHAGARVNSGDAGGMDTYSCTYVSAGGASVRSNPLSGPLGGPLAGVL